MSGLGPMRGSGFWLIATGLFDPPTAPHQFRRVAGLATLAGPAGAPVADRVAAPCGVRLMRPVPAALRRAGARRGRAGAARRRSRRRARRGAPRRHPDAAGPRRAEPRVRVADSTAGRRATPAVAERA